MIQPVAVWQYRYLCSVSATQDGTDEVINKKRNEQINKANDQNNQNEYGSSEQQNYMK